MSDWLSVTIVFEQSHLFFPRIIHWLLLIMGIVIVITQAIPYLREVREGRKQLPFADGPIDGLRTIGTLVLTVIYFLAMPAVGERFPNTGLGFLIMSIPYMAALSILYLHDRDKRHLTFALINAIVAPVVAWYVLAQLFTITLP